MNSSRGTGACTRTDARHDVRRCCLLSMCATSHIPFPEWILVCSLKDLTPENIAFTAAHNAGMDAQFASTKSSTAKKAKAGSAKPRESSGGAAGAAGEGVPLTGHKRKLKEAEEDSAAAASPLLKFNFPASLKKVVVEEWGFITQKCVGLHGATLRPMRCCCGG